MSRTEKSPRVGRSCLPLIAIVCVAASGAARADYQTVDLSPYVNEGFTNSWFLGGADFAASIVGTTFGNQGSSVPFQVANPADGAGSSNNFWFGLYSGPGSLAGPPGSVTIPVAGAHATAVYTLADNTFGTPGALEYTVTFSGSGGTVLGNYVGGDNTKDYNLNYGTTGGTATPNAAYWYANGSGQWLQIVKWELPADFGLSAIRFDQVHGGDGAIIAGVTLENPASVVPLPPALPLFGGALFALGARRRR